MSSTPYFDRVMSKTKLQGFLAKLGARVVPGRGNPKTQAVYALDGGGEALIERAASATVSSTPGAEPFYRVRLYRGKCAC